MAARLSRRPSNGERLTAAAYRWTYALRLAFLLPDSLRRVMVRRLAIGGAGVLDAAASAGQGIVLVSGHVGDLELAASWLTARGFEVVALAQPQSGFRDRFLRLVRRRCGVRVRYEDQTSLHDLAKDLRAGRAVVLMLDRPPKGRAVTATFAGRPSRLSIAPWALTAKTGAPVIIAATLRQRWRPVAHFRVPPIPPTAGAEAFVAGLGETLAELLALDPRQWRLRRQSERRATAQ